MNAGPILRARRPAALAAMSLAALVLVGAGCGRSDPDGGSAVPVAAAAPGGEAGPSDGAPLAPEDTEPLPPELAEIFALIEQYRTGPARVRIVKFRKLHPESGKAAFLFGLSYHREKRYEKAVGHYVEAIELDPGYSPAYHFLGWACYYLGRAEEARAAFERHLHYQADVADSQFAVGLIDLEQDRLDDAERRFRRAIELQELGPGPPKARDLAKAYAQLGEVCARTGRLEEARAALEHAVGLFPDHYEAYYRLSRVLVQLGDEAGAERALELHQAAKQRVRPGTSFPED